MLGVAFAVCYWQNDWLLTTINKPLQSTRKISADSDKRSPLEDTARLRPEDRAAPSA